MISKGHPKLTMEQMCALLTVCRSSLYVTAKGESAENLKFMRLMDEHYLKYPYKGAPRMHKYLTLDCGFKINPKRTSRLYYEVMGLRAVMPGPHTSKRNKKHKIFPYLLRDLQVVKPNQVWAIDITYIPMEKGFLYLTAIIDLYSRFVVGWSVSNTMDAEWCAEVFNEAVGNYGKPEIINTDQGSQFTSDVFVEMVTKTHSVRLSMDGKGRATDNAFIERLWRSVKYEKIYLMPPQDGKHLFYMLNDYFRYYNYKRRHSSIDDYHPATVYKPQLKVAA